MEERLISLVLDMGEQMLQSGSEVSRVEDTIERILKAYGFKKADVFTITSEIQVTAIDGEEHCHTQLRRLHKWGTNLKKLEELNQLSRYLCEMRPDCESFQKRLSAIEAENKKGRKEIILSYVGAVLAACGFTVFFGGNFCDAAATLPLACLINYMDCHSNLKNENQLLYYFLFAVVTGFIGNLFMKMGAAVGIAFNLDKVLIGCIMLTIPGIAITFSVRDMLLGETITGLFRFVESLLVAAGIASGYIVSSLLMGVL